MAWIKIRLHKIIHTIWKLTLIFDQNEIQNEIQNERVDSIPNNKILFSSKIKAVIDHKLDFKRVETLQKEEKNGYVQCFQIARLPPLSGLCGK